MNLWRVRVLVVLLALRAVLQLLPADVADAERHAVETALLFVPETARVLATAGVLVAVVICVPDVPEVALEHVRVGARQLAADFVTGAAIHVIRIAQNVSGHAVKHVLRVVLPHVDIIVLADVQIHVLAVEALALTIVLDVPVAPLVVALVPVVLLVLEPVQDVTDVATNALPHVSNLAPDVLVAVHAEHHVGQAVNPLVVILVPERAVMAALTHAVRVALPVQRIVLQTAERLARAHATEA